MTRTGRTQRLAEHLICRACKHLPEHTRDERYREWTAELPAILHDPDTRPAPLRALRAIRYAADHTRTTRQLSRTTRPRAKPAKTSPNLSNFNSLARWLISAFLAVLVTVAAGAAVGAAGAADGGIGAVAGGIGAAALPVVVVVAASAAARRRTRRNVRPIRDRSSGGGH